MNYTSMDQEIAEQQLKITNEFGYSVAFMTVWKGSVLSFVFDKITARVINFSYSNYLENYEIMLMEDLAIELLEEH